MRNTILLFILFAIACNNPNGSEEGNASSTQEQATQEKEEIQHYDNGVVMTQGVKINGKRNGLWISNYDTGKRWSESYYKMDVLHGTTTVYYPSGIMYYKGKFRNGKRTGQWVFYTQDGKIDYVDDYPN